ncbi:MAG: sulfurtransferase TusA family protein [Deltaproteobacteria bacterium]|jgi:TusA-related sulfurtransferase|nr:sulfurtransferase TusA family protein [Deltaproteobacteria bacterium]
MTGKDGGGGPPRVVDTTGARCPMTFVLAKMALDDLEDGEVVAVRLSEGEALANVPRSIKEEGHKILKLVDNGDGTYDLIVRKTEGADGP